MLFRHHPTKYYCNFIYFQITQIFLVIFLCTLTIGRITSKPLEESSSSPDQPESARMAKDLDVPEEEVLVLEPINEIQYKTLPSVSPYEEEEEKNVDPVNLIQVVSNMPNEHEGDGESMETANTVLFMPRFTYRRVSSQRRRVYLPSRRSSYYPKYYHTDNQGFPTLA